MTCKEAWCKILNEIDNTYDDETREALFMLAIASQRQDDETKALSHLIENPYAVSFDKKDVCCCKEDNTKEKSDHISIFDKDRWNVNALKQFEEQKLK